MKRILIYGILMAVSLLIPRQRSDVGTLRPVEVVQVYREHGAFVIATDTNDMGKGRTIQSAFRELKETTPGTIYLDTADFLLVEEGEKEVLPELKEVLKSSVKVCLSERKVDLKDAAAYLAVHSPKFTLEEAERAEDLEELTIVENRLILR